MRKDITGGPDELKQWIDGEAAEFEKNRALYVQFLTVLKAALDTASKTLPGYGIVQGRIKDLDSFVEKCIRKRHKYHNPARQLTDLCGVRVVLVSEDAVPRFRNFIENHFIVSERENTSQRLREMEFGYQSVHYIVSLDPDKKNFYESLSGKIPAALFDVRPLDAAKQAGLSPGSVFKAEIQVRTLLQHAWSSAVHDTLYKTEMKKIPKRLSRKSALIAALLEDAETSIVNLVEDAEDYRSYFGAYMTDREMQDEIVLQRIILDRNPGNKKAAIKIARLSDCLENQADSKMVEEILSCFPEKEDPNILRELGMVRWKLGKREEGRKHLLDASEADSGNADTWCELGETYLEDRNYPEAFSCFERAFGVAPEYPRALMRYLLSRFLMGRSDAVSVIPLVRHNLGKAIEISRARIDAGVHLPHAWYDIGFFNLLLGRPYESLEAYAKALWATTSPGPVQFLYDLLLTMEKKLSNEEAEPVKGLRQLCLFFKIILVGKFHALPPESLGCLPEACQSKTAPRKELPFSEKDNIVIVAGSCSEKSEKIILEYKPLIRKAFAGFSGIICSGGTSSGISGIVGRLDDNGGALKRVAYLPDGKPCMATYRCVGTDNETFSPMDPLMLWKDLLLAGIDPASVRLLGVRGGEISMFEYQLALLLGAKVGVLPDSGGEARRFSDDPDWNSVSATHGEKSRLLRLPTDLETLRCFITSSRPSGLIDPSTREKLAAELHESYSREIRENYITALPANIVPWGKLDQTFKNANLALIDHIEEKLKRVGLSIRRPVDREPQSYTFRPEDIHLLAEMEHGRWVVERLEDGWTLGERDDQKKTRPQLIPWEAISEDEKKKDYVFIRRLPELLAKEGYEIFLP